MKGAVRLGMACAQLAPPHRCQSLHSLDSDAKSQNPCAIRFLFQSSAPCHIVWMPFTLAAFVNKHGTLNPPACEQRAYVSAHVKNLVRGNQHTPEVHPEA